MCDRNTWLLIKQANILSDIVSGIALGDINPTRRSYESLMYSYNPYGDKDFVDTVNKLSDEDKHWTDIFPWNADEPAYRKGKLQKRKAEEFKQNYTDNLERVRKYWVDQLNQYKGDWNKTHGSKDDIKKDPIYKKLVEATKKFTPTEFFKGFKPYIPPEAKSNEKNILKTILSAKFIRKWFRNKLIFGSLGFK